MAKLVVGEYNSRAEDFTDEASEPVSTLAGWFGSTAERPCSHRVRARLEHCVLSSLPPSMFSAHVAATFWAETKVDTTIASLRSAGMFGKYVERYLIIAGRLTSVVRLNMQSTAERMYPVETGADVDGRRYFDD